MAKQANPDTSVPNAAAPSELACGAVVPALASSFTPTTNVTEIAGLASTNATVTWTSRRPAPRITGDTDDDHTIGANAATRYSSDDRMNSTTVVTSSPTMPNSSASGPRNVVASPPALAQRRGQPVEHLLGVGPPGLPHHAGQHVGAAVRRAGRARATEALAAIRAGSAGS